MLKRLILLFSLLTLLSPLAKAQSILVDELVATVNGDPITQSDVIWAIALNPQVKNEKDYLQNIPLMLEQIIDQRLLLAEAARLPNLDPSPIEISKAIGEVIKKFPSEQIFYQRVNKVGLTAEMLQQIFRDRLLILKYIDFRFRAFALISEAEIVDYYEQNLKPKIKDPTIVLPDKPSDQERKLIEAILIEERVNNQIEQFLESAHQQADIVQFKTGNNP
jgi:hypothetical protein